MNFFRGVYYYIQLCNIQVFNVIQTIFKMKKNKKKLRINSLDGVMFKVVKLFFFGFIHNFLVLNKKYKFWRTTVDQGLLYNFVQFRELYCLCLFLNNFFFFGFSGGCLCCKCAKRSSSKIWLTLLNATSWAYLSFKCLFRALNSFEPIQSPVETPKH